MASQSSPLLSCCSAKTIDGSFYISESREKTQDFGHLHLIHAKCTKCKRFLRVQSHKPHEYNKYRLTADQKKLDIEEVVQMIKRFPPPLRWCNFTQWKLRKCKVLRVVHMKKAPKKQKALSLNRDTTRNERVAAQLAARFDVDESRLIKF